MNCTRCGAPLPEGSAFCNRCGAATAPSPVQTPPAANAEPESDLWKGRYSGKADAHLWALWFAWVVALLYLWFGVLGPETRKIVAAPWIFASAAALPVLSLAGTLALRKLSVRYRLTTHRLFRETGVLLRRFNELELLRVDDVAVKQNLVQRIFNVGTVTVIAPSDATEPRVEMLGIEDPLRVKELIRTQVRKRRERSVYMESL
jgi:uncharacterized membrane protein YdbT with pleckstrin-like domain